jgi:sec-independent protein translocase protein TatC
MPSDRFDHSEDMFADTRMSFGEHIEELRTHLIRAIKGLVFCVSIGFILDGIGYSLGLNWLGIGRPMMDVITAPVNAQLEAFHQRRLEKYKEDAKVAGSDAATTAAPKPLKVTFTPAAIAKLTNNQVRPENSVDVEIAVSPLDLYDANHPISAAVRPEGLTTLSVQEGMVVYFKVSIICGLVLASPWVFWQIWSFVAAGLYKTEKRLVNYWLPMSLGLFLAGVALCQFAVIPRSIAALLWFNEWMGLTPELRLSEWLGLAIWLPVIFGLAFQTPLVMLVLERIGIMSVATYLSYWRAAVFILGVVTVIIVPTTDLITWFALWLPMVGLYFLGIYLCSIAARRRPAEFDDPDLQSDELVEV